MNLYQNQRTIEVPLATGNIEESRVLQQIASFRYVWFHWWLLQGRDLLRHPCWGWRLSFPSCPLCMVAIRAWPMAVRHHPEWYMQQTVCICRNRCWQIVSWLNAQSNRNREFAAEEQAEKKWTKDTYLWTGWLKLLLYLACLTLSRQSSIYICTPVLQILSQEPWV